LKKASENLLPSETLYKKKKGFSVPSVSWLSCNYEHNIINGYASRDGVWNKKFVKKLLQRKIHQDQKWLLYTFERWYTNQFYGINEPIPYKFTDRVKNKIGKFLD
jgi:asparagine synthetase B (glutamine-hydrolysing)